MKTPRSVYLARLRRAFLLRVHPDRFQCPSIRASQAALVKALSSRWSLQDFSSWQQQQSMNHADSASYYNGGRHGSFPYVLEQRNGQLVEMNLCLDASVETILHSMAQALHHVGAAAALPKEPPADHSSIPSPFPYPNSNNGSTTTQQPATTAVDHQFDIQSNRGRNLRHFLQDLNVEEIHQLKTFRMDAQAAALAVRRLYGFQAVDATGLGWSSEWVANLLRRLLALHREEAAKKSAASVFQVDSFYPIRLQISNAASASATEHHLDVIGGILYLSPASTSIQWLESFQLVTPAKLQQIQEYQTLVSDYTKLLQSALGIQLKKGHTCSHADYFYFLQDLVEAVQAQHPDTIHKGTTDQRITLSSNALATKMIVATVESSVVCRRPRVIADGSIRLGVGNQDAMIAIIAQHGPRARETRAHHQARVQDCQEIIHRAQWQLGVQKVTRSPRVSHDEFLDAVGRLLQVSSSSVLKDDVHVQLPLQMLGGNSVLIAGTGQFCGIADDGALVIPHNWQ